MFAKIILRNTPKVTLIVSGQPGEFSVNIFNCSENHDTQKDRDILDLRELYQGEFEVLNKNIVKTLEKVIHKRDYYIVAKEGYNFMTEDMRDYILSLT